MESIKSIEGNLVDIHLRKTYPARISYSEGIIREVTPIPKASGFLLPGFIDAHIHIESSMLVPSEFARMAVCHGTVATVSDPHEIANVLGTAGVDYMISNGAETPFKFYFGAPSCVPATNFETSGATIDSGDIKNLLERKEIKYLAEMMNWPGVLNGDPEVVAKIAAAKKAAKPVDGHAPGLKGEQAQTYAYAGITTDHECVSLDEALDKISAGMKILIREGSAAKNFEALHPLIASHPERIMFCSDDKHPDALEISHINALVTRSLELGYDLYDVLRISSLHPVEHYGLHVGLLRQGDPADFVVVDSLNEWNVLETYIQGKCVYKDKKTQITSVPITTTNQFNIGPINSTSLQVPAITNTMRVIVAQDGSLLTESAEMKASIVEGLAVSDTPRDILKMVVLNRYQTSKPAIGFVKNFGLVSGAIASSVGHDSHNITAVGADDAAIASAINAIIEHRGGISAVGLDKKQILPLPVAGLMSDLEGAEVAEQYTQIDAFAKQLGSTLSAPFMTLSFMSLLVIPDLKLSDQGLFSGKKFDFVDLFC